MNPWPFVAAAWVLVVGATALMALLTLRAMRRAEAAAETQRR